MDMGYWKLILVLIVYVHVSRSSPLNQYIPQDEPDGQDINSPTDEQERSGDSPIRPRLGSTHNPNIRHIDPGHDGDPAEEEGGEKMNPAVQETTAPRIDGDTFGPDVHVNQPTEGSQSTPSTRRPSTLPVSRHDPEEDKPKKEPGGAVLPLTPTVPLETTTPTTPRTPPTKKTKPPPITTSSTASPTETPGTTVIEKPVKPVISTPSTKKEETTTPATTTSPSTTQTKEEATTPSVSVKTTLSTTFSNTQSVLSTTHKFVEKSTTHSTQHSATSTTSTPSSPPETTESSTSSQTSYPETKKIESSTPTQSTGSSITSTPFTKTPASPNTSATSFETTSTTKSEPKTPESTSTSSVTAMTTSGATIQTIPEPKSTTHKPTVPEPLTTSTKSSTKHFTSNPTTPATSSTHTQHTSTTEPSVTVTTTESTSQTMTPTLSPQTSPHISQSSIKTETFNPTTSTSDSPTSKTSATTKHQMSVTTSKDLPSTVSTPSTAKIISTVTPKTSSVHPQRETSTSSMDTTVIKTSKQTTATKPTTVTFISTTGKTTVRTSSADINSTEQSSPTTRVFTTSNSTTSPPTSTGTPSTVTSSSETTTSISIKPSKQPSKSPTTTQQSKSTTSKVTSQGRTTIHPTALPPTYLIVRLQMRWDSFCIIIEKFKDLLLGYIDADEEASVELLENECEYYELKEKQSIIRRDVSRQLERRDIVNDQYYNQNYEQKSKYDTITVKVYIKNDEGRADKALTQKVFDNINQFGKGQRLPKGFEYFDGKIRSVQIRGPTTEKLHPGLEVEAKMTTPIIVAITTVMSVCLISLIIISAVIYRRKTQRGRRSMRPSIRGYPDDDNFSLSSFSTSSFRRSKQRIGRQSLKSIATINQGFSHDEHTYTNSMTLNKLSLRSLEMDYLEEELKSIPSNMPKMSALPPGAQAKNRYANVIPLESSRVTLKSRPASGCSQYINANYVSGYNGVPKVYIATQAPLETTVKDFWSMVWENQSQVIVMMMDWVEDGQRRCADYLPQSDAVGDSIAVYGDYEIFMKKQIIGDQYIFSCLTLKNMELNLCRDVVHFQYLDFPTKGSPSSVGSFLNFIKEMRPYMEVSHGPSVVHCSTGTGRTGTLMAIDLCMQAYDDSQSVDIMNCVYRIRNERAGAVHTTSHYAFIYKTMLEYANRTGASNSPSKWSSMSSLG